MCMNILCLRFNKIQPFFPVPIRDGRLGHLCHKQQVYGKVKHPQGNHLHQRQGGRGLRHIRIFRIFATSKTTADEPSPTIPPYGSPHGDLCLSRERPRLQICIPWRGWPVARDLHNALRCPLTFCYRPLQAYGLHHTHHAILLSLSINCSLITLHWSLITLHWSLITGFTIRVKL